MTVPSLNGIMGLTAPFFWRKSPSEETDPLTIEQPLRGELLSVDLLKQFARNLAQDQQSGNRTGPNLLLPRLAENERILRSYNTDTLRAEKTRQVTPAGEWMLDNFHLMEEQIRMVRRHLPRGFNRQLPQLLNGPYAGYPRVYELAVELVSHVDGRVDAAHLAAFVGGYQEIKPLKLGELWAVPIMIRLALIENLRRMAVVMGRARHERDQADEWARRILEVAESNPPNLIIAVGEMARAQPSLTQAFVTEFLRRMQEKSPPVKLATSWIESHLTTEGLTMEQLFHSEGQLQASTQVSVGNCIGSLRFLDAMDWQKFVEGQSVVEQKLRTDPAAIYAQMDFLTRDMYRHAVERIARYSRISELEVAELAINLTQKTTRPTEAGPLHAGYFLAGKGVRQLERAAGMKAPVADQVRGFMRRHPLPFYLGGILLVTLAAVVPLTEWIHAAGAQGGLLFLFLMLTGICASQLAVSVVNWFATIFVRPEQLPRLDFSKGVPAGQATLVVIPTMLTDSRVVENLLETLEVRYLANCDKNIYFALLTDFPDAAEEHRKGDDELVQQVTEGVDLLNKKYLSDRPCIFYLFHRPRRWNEREHVWMGYERKRGKLADLNRFLRGGHVESFMRVVGDVAKLPRIKYVITLDTDTNLPRDAAQQLAATMAHPLNAPVYDERRGVIVEGYSIMQPRVAVSLPSANRSRFVKMFSGDSGIDPYTRNVSDVFQDVFHEGSFIGKGIYDVDAFEQAVGGKFPENRILSHDLLEGCYARSALVSDVQLFEDFPARYSSDTRRRHRWMRGDWQIAAWLLPRLPGPDVRWMQNPLTGLSRWKIFDNLRRSLVPPALLFLLVGGWIAFPALAPVWSGLVLLLICLPSLLAILADLMRKSREQSSTLHLQAAGRTILRQAGQVAFTVAFLPYDAIISLDAVVRTLGRLGFTGRNLLEWQTSSEVDKKDTGQLRTFWITMWCAPVVAAAIGVALYLVGPPSGWYCAPFLALWFLSPGIAWWISLPLKEIPPGISAEETRRLHVLARKTWAFFETYVSPEDNWLPPDNFQEYPRPVLATRTSPTNIGLAMLGTLAARDFGYLALDTLRERLGDTLDTLERIERYQGHLYNWYDTRNLRPLQPLYISTVDNGNFSGMLLTLHSGLLELMELEWSAQPIFGGLRDTLFTWQEQAGNPGDAAAIGALEKILPGSSASVTGVLTALDRLLESTSRWAGSASGAGADFEAWRKVFEKSCREHRTEILTRFPWAHLHERITAHLGLEGKFELHELWKQLNHPPSMRRLAEKSENWLAKLDAWQDEAESHPGKPELNGLLPEFAAALDAGAQNARLQMDSLEKLAARCDALARMDFRLLYDTGRELFSIGYNVSQHRLDASFYDLLASEARLGSFVAIALGQVSQNHWFRLGRLLTFAGRKPALISWSGSMFEYLMPMLVMPTYENTLLDSTCKAAVIRQIAYGRQMHIPWGISESGYNLRDADANYQYRAFGVPGLGFKRGLAEDVVVAPYATVMALMVAPERACGNMRQLTEAGATGKFGFYEALDYTPSRVPNGQTHAVIRSFMVHHEGMSLLALTSLLLNRPMQRRFASNPLFKSADLLLHERVPKETPALYPHEFEAGQSREGVAAEESNLRIFKEPSAGPPEVHLLSNGRYHVMVTNAGGGYSRWNDYALTRWGEDATRDCWGTFIYLRDQDSGKLWSTALQPTLQSVPGYEAIFSQGRAEFRSRVDEVDNHTEITVSPENDVEVRRITLTNHSDETRTIEVTSYAEVVLTQPDKDWAHPAFSKLFVQTKFLSEYQGVLCSRRPRAAADKLPWMFHLMLLEGTETGKISFETDRSRFLGRGGSTRQPAIFNDQEDLPGSEGSVLDPIVSLRRTVRLAPKESASVTLVSGIAPTREQTLALMAAYQDQTIADRSFELAWTHGLVVLRHLNISEAEAQLYGRLAGALLYHQASRRANTSVLARNQRGQRNLWSYGISGDLPVILVHAARLDQLELVRQLIQAHAYWRLKGLMSDLVILHEDDSIYRSSSHDHVMNLIAASNATQMIDKPGGVFVRRAEQMPAEDRVLLETTARVVLRDTMGTLAEQLQRRTRPEPLQPLLRIRPRAALEPDEALPQRDLIFFNGLGGFTPDGREYVITLEPGQVTPAPWVNVLANADFGTLVSESGGAYTWGENCHEFRLTPWQNDPVTDASGEAFYIRDERTGRYWSPTPLPARGTTPYVCRHGFGYTIFEHVEDGIESELTVYVDSQEPVKFMVFKLRNHSDRSRQLSVTGYWEWVLGEHRHKNAMYIATEVDGPTGALLARNPYNTEFAGRIAFVGGSELIRSFTADRQEFLGRNGTFARPAALSRARLSGKTGYGLDPCAALQAPVQLEPGQEREISFILGSARDVDTARRLIQKYQPVEACRAALQGVWDYWKKTLGAVQVETPEPALNVLANGWLLYQTIACRFWARTGFYQSGGAFGFRDQLQDAMAMVHTRPELLREQILRAAAHQFHEGDVQHWWHPPQDRGVRTHFSDDYLWLPLAVCRYVEAIGDTGVLDEKLPFLEGRALRPEEESYYDLPQRSADTATLYEHCVRAVRNGLKFGAHGLPLMGCGDWNDGMNLVGEHGKGESVWLAFFLYDLLKRFAVLAGQRGDEAFAKECGEQATTLRETIEREAWDGQWYRRAYFDNGEPLGSAQNPECQIDSLPQSWAVISGAGDATRCRTALDAVAHRLVRRDAQLIQLFDPPFDKSTLEPGYIKGYVPGVRENGGQYTHAAIWTIMAFALAGEASRAWELFTLINPVLHSETPEKAARYKAEPYVVAADVYSVPPHQGRGGWTWYTGSAGWMYRLITETFLGLNRTDGRLTFTPHLPPEWKSFKLDYRYQETVYHLTLLNVSGTWKLPPVVSEKNVQHPPGVLNLQDDHQEHFVEVRFDQ